MNVWARGSDAMRTGKITSSRYNEINVLIKLKYNDEIVSCFGYILVI